MVPVEYPASGCVYMNMRMPCSVPKLMLVMTGALTLLVATACLHAMAGHESLVIAEQTSSEVLGKLKVTGKGLPPSRMKADSGEARLMARQAAIVDSYRNMAVLVADVTPYLIGGSGEIIVEGYIQGARVTETRYLADGWVQVDLELPVKLLPAIRGSVATINAGHGEGRESLVRVVDLDRAIYEIDRTEWEELVGSLQEP